MPVPPLRIPVRLQRWIDIVTPHARDLRARLHPRHLQRLNLTAKIKASLIVSGVGLLVIALAYWRANVGADHAADIFAAHQASATLTDTLAQQIAESRRLQAAYAQTLAAEDRQSLSQAQRALATTLEKLAAASAGHRSPQLKTVEAHVAQFGEGVASLNARVDEMGEGDASLRMQLESTASALEVAVDAQQRADLSLLVQRMRRHEARFLLTGDSAETDRVSEDKLPFDLALSASRIPATAQDALRAAMDAYQGALLAYTAARIGLDVEAQSLRDVATGIPPALAALDKAQLRALKQARAEQQAQTRWMSAFFLLTWLVVSFALVATLWAVMRAVRAPLQDTLRFAQDIADDRLDTALSVHNPHDEIGQLANVLQHMREQLRARIASERAVARENERARQALDSAQTGLLVIDAHGAISLANRSLVVALDLADMAEWTGRPASRLHPAFEDVQQRLKGGETFFLIEVDHDGQRYQWAISAMQVEGQRIGAAIEWRSLAVELTVELEIAALVNEAAHGDLHGRLVLENKHGFVHTLSTSINRLLDAFQDNLDALQSVLASLSQGDLRTRMQGDFHGVFGRMRDDANATMAQLTQIVSRIQHAARSIGTGAGGISTRHADLSRHAGDQATQLAATAQAIDTLTATVQQNRESAQQANRLVAGAADVAARGGEAVQQVVRMMADIQRSSREISDITAVIDRIAFQTNILALNASVEAARAGEQGRGFAVVATEVRTLAQQSALAAKDIKALIGRSVERVSEGSLLVDRAGATMDEIVASVRGVTGIMGEIATASHAQSASIARVHAAVGQIDQASRQSNQLVGEASVAAHGLERQARGLLGSVAAFRLAELEAAA